MRRLWILIAVGVAAIFVFAVVKQEASDDGPVAPLPDPAACEPGARDRNPKDREIEPSRGEPLIARVDGHIPVGFNDSAFLVGQLELEQGLRLYEPTDATIWRLPLDWGEVESSPGEVNFAKYDEIYCAAIAAGVRPLWSMTGIPPWAAPIGRCNSVPCVRPPEEEHLAQLRRFAELAAIRYPQSAAFEAWNEPNLVGFWGGAPNPADYLPILEAVYDGVKNGDPRMPVLGGALSNNPTDEPGGNLSLQTYLGAMVEGGALEHMDGFALHAYPIAQLGTEGDLFTPALAFTRQLFQAAGEDVRLWVTEIGAPTEPGVLPDVTPDEQAAMMSDAYEALDGSADADAIIFHTLVDPTPEVPAGPGYGFFTAPSDTGTVTAKPVNCRIVRLREPSAECPETVALNQ